MLRRDELLVRAALSSRGSTVWRHVSGEGWMELPFSPERLETMSDAELEELVAGRARRQADLSARVRKQFPDFERDGPSDPLDEIGFCNICGTTIDKTAEAYLAWDEARREWSVYCAAHRPGEYWRHLDGTR